MVSSMKQNFELHVLLIMRQDSLPRSKAMVVAYEEGPSKLEGRMGAGE